MDLTAVSKWFKKAIVVFGVFLFGYYFVFHLILPGGIHIVRSALKTKLKPNTVYGKLPQLEFIEKPITNEEYPSIKLNTPSGRLPVLLPPTMKVYKYKPPMFSYLAGSNAIEDAALLGFEEKDLISDLKGTTYRWRNLDTGGVLTIKINERELMLDTSLRGKSYLFPRGGIDEAGALKKSIALLESLNRFEDTFYTEGSQKTYLGAYSGTRILEAASLGEAQLARVDFFRSIDDYPILGPDPNKGLLHIILKNPSREPNASNYPIIEAFYWEINPNSEAVYPVIEVKDAWEAVKEGKGVMSGIIPEDQSPFEDYEAVEIDTILIDNIYIAYYDSIKSQTYLQPIYVFEGTYQSRKDEDGEITIYFPAVPGEYIQQTPSTKD